MEAAYWMIGLIQELVVMGITELNRSLWSPTNNNGALLMVRESVWMCVCVCVWRCVCVCVCVCVHLGCQFSLVKKPGFLQSQGILGNEKSDLFPKWTKKSV